MFVCVRTNLGECESLQMWCGRDEKIRRVKVVANLSMLGEGSHVMKLRLSASCGASTLPPSRTKRVCRLIFPWLNEYIYSIPCELLFYYAICECRTPTPPTPRRRTLRRILCNLIAIDLHNCAWHKKPVSTPHTNIRRVNLNVECIYVCISVRYFG